MTEEQWIETNTALAMIDYIESRSSDRKLRLFACAACRRIWHTMPYDSSHQAVEVSERFADGQAREEELRLLAGDADAWADLAEQERTPGWNAARTAALTAGKQALQAAQRTAVMAADCDLVRELFGNPFRPTLLDNCIQSWRDSTVPRLAQSAYDNRILPAGTLDKTLIAILADAIEEAGCTDEQVSTHLRSGCEHYRGCWVIDLLLSKQ